MYKLGATGLISIYFCSETCNSWYHMGCLHGCWSFVGQQRKTTAKDYLKHCLEHPGCLSGGGEGDEEKEEKKPQQVSLMKFFVKTTKKEEPVEGEPLEALQGMALPVEVVADDEPLEEIDAVEDLAEIERLLEVEK